MEIQKLLTPAETAAALHVAVQTLSIWRCTRRYNLPYIKIGRMVKYREADVQKFIENNMKGTARAA